MSSRIVVLIGTILLATGCQNEANGPTTPDSDDPSPGSAFSQGDAPRPTEPEENREAIESIEKRTLQLELEYREQNSDAELQPGEWRIEDGVKVCTGYLTRVENRDFCAADVPSDWKPFDFDGQTYYFQPLSRDFEEP